jgi:hypothetical protein
MPTSRRLPPLPWRTRNRASARIQVAFGQRERLADAQPGAPQHDDQTAKPDSVGVIAGGAHDRDDLLDSRWIGGISQPFVAWWAAPVKVRQGGWRATPTARVQQRRG